MLRDLPRVFGLSTLTDVYFVSLLIDDSFNSRDLFITNTPRARFSIRPGNLTGPVSHFEIKVSRKVGCVLTSNEVHFVSQLANNFTVPFSKLLKLPSLMENKTA